MLGAHTGPTEEETMDTNVQKLGDSPSERQRTQVSQEREQRGRAWVQWPGPWPGKPVG